MADVPERVWLPDYAARLYGKGKVYDDDIEYRRVHTMKQQNSGRNSNTSLQARLEILLSRYYSVTITATEHGYHVHCEDIADMDTANSSMYEQLDKAVKELTPDV